LSYRVQQASTFSLEMRLRRAAGSANRVIRSDKERTARVLDKSWIRVKETIARYFNRQNDSGGLDYESGET
jgi:hypothetical protein